MSRFKGALLGAVVTAVALPGAAQAATITVHDTSSSPPHAFSYKAAAGEANNLRFSEAADGSTIVTDTAPLRIAGESSLQGCRFDGTDTIVCAPNVRPSGIETGDGNDVVRILASESMGTFRFGGGIDLGAGNDTIFAGIRRNADGVQAIEGGAGTADKVTYASAAAPVTASLNDFAADGVTGDKQVLDGFEVLEGSGFGDPDRRQRRRPPDRARRHRRVRRGRRRQRLRHDRGRRRDRPRRLLAAHQARRGPHGGPDPQRR
jgi:hypothetical protein